MEDAVDALKMAFSVFAFIIALSIVFAMFAQAREVSDIVLAHTDNTYFVEYADVNDEVNGRTVGIETIIPTLYRYYKEKFSIDIITGSDNTYNEKFDEEVERKVYTRAEGYDTSEYKKLYPDGITWLANPTEDTQLRVTSYIEGKENSVNGRELSKYSNTNRNLKDYKDSTFTETFDQKNNGENRYVGDDGSVVYLIKGTTKLHISYELLHE